MLEDLVEVVHGGLSRSLVLVGEPGIGKTRLLDHVAGVASDLTVVSTAGVESEMRLGFAALHRLLAPLLDRVDTLPAPQRDALRSTFGLTTGSPPDRFLVGLATLTLLADAAAERPLLCLVDDAQWLDPESLAVLGFVTRRLRADAVGVVFGERDGAQSPSALDGLPVRRLTGLARSDALALLSALVAGRLDGQVAARLVAETGGNPLALVESAGALSAEQLAGWASLPASLPVGRRLEALFLHRVQALPADTRLLLLVAAAEPPHDPAVLWRAAAQLGIASRAVDPAVSAGILSGGLEFAHPLIRSAVYSGASIGERRRVHEALAASLCDDRDRDRDRRAWHLAAVAFEPDESVAGELERSAERARGRGGYSAQAAFLLRAAELTPDPENRTGRLFGAASASLIAGDPVAAQALADRATPLLTRPGMRVRAQRLQAGIEWSRRRWAAVPALLLGAATADDVDRRLAREMLFDALQAALVAREHTSGTTLLDIARTACGTPGLDGDAPTARDLLLDGLAALVARGYPTAVPLLREAIERLRTGDELVETGVPLAVTVLWVTDELWDDRSRQDVLHRIDRFDRDRGALLPLRVTLVASANSEVSAGRLAAAEALFAEYTEISRAAGLHPETSAFSVELLAWQGHEEEARAACATAIHELGERKQIGAAAHSAIVALTVLELSLGRYRDAIGWARRLFDDDLPGAGNRILADLVEAGTRGGDRAVATAALERLADRASVSGTPWALGLLARGRALLAGDDDAEDLYRQSIRYLGDCTVATELARTHLLYGEWLRRRRRRADARAQLRVASDAFTHMGADGFAERARVELLATGGRTRRRTTQQDVVLTPQEARIARLVTEGATNAEIAARLFISASTVEYHLNKIFRKLDLTSRRQLAQVLRGQPVRGVDPPPERERGH